MSLYTIVSDGVTKLTPTKSQGNVTDREKSTIVIESNVDAATITFGTVINDNTFQAYSEGEMNSGDDVFNHGYGVQLAVIVSGISTNPVKIRVSD